MCLHVTRPRVKMTDSLTVCNKWKSCHPTYFLISVFIFSDFVFSFDYQYCNDRLWLKILNYFIVRLGGSAVNSEVQKKFFIL